VLYLTGTGRCYYRYRNVIPDVVDEFYIKATIGTVLINAVNTKKTNLSPLTDCYFWEFQANGKTGDIKISVDIDPEYMT
jgi:hypothetical protein